MKKRYLFLLLLFLFVPRVHAEYGFGGEVGVSFESATRCMMGDRYGNYTIPSNNSAYFFSGTFPTSPSTTEPGIWAFEGISNYKGGHYYSITIYTYNTDRSVRVTPADDSHRRIGMGNSMNAARINWVNDSGDVANAFYTNYSYDSFDVKLVSGSTFSGVYSVTYFFKTISNNSGLAVPFGMVRALGGTYYFAGFELTDLGDADNLTESQMRSIINSSGLATAQSVNEVKQGINEVKREVSDVNNSINNNDVTDAEDSAGGFFNDFTTDTHGLTAVITAPLSLISSITSSSCSPLVIPLPYVDKNLTLPCMGTIYSNYFGPFLSIYQMITFGIVAYWVLVRIFNLVKDFKNPDHDEIEVLDL